MNKLIMYEYIKRIRKEDILNFANSQGIQLEEYEVLVIYDYIKNDYKRIFSNPEDILEEVKYKLSDLTYCKLLELYNKYKNKIS